MEILLVRAANPSPYTLDGTNSYVVGRDPAWVLDPGPALDVHLDALAAAVAERGGAGGIINIAVELEDAGYDTGRARERVLAVGDTLRSVLELAEAERTTPLAAAQALARTRLA